MRFASLLLVLLLSMGCGSGGGGGGSAGSGGAGGSGGCGHDPCPGQCNDSGWCAVPDVGGMLFTDVWGSAPDDVWVLAQGATVRHFDGSTWTSSELPTTYDVDRIWGRAKNDLWVGGGSGQVAHFDGTAWTLDPLPVSERVVGFWSSGPNDPLIALMSSGTLFERQAAGWAPVVTLPPTGWAGRAGKPRGCDGYRYVPGAQMFSDVEGEWKGFGYSGAGEPASTAIALGASQTWVAAGRVLRHDGTSWRWHVSELELGGVVAFAGTSETDVWALGSDGRLFRSDGGSFVEALGATEVDGAQWISAPSAGVVELVDARGKISRWDGTTLSSVAPETFFFDADGVGQMASGELMALADHRLYRFDPTLSSWQELEYIVQSGGGTALIAGTSATDVWIAQGGGVYHWNGTEISSPSIPAPQSQSYEALAALAPNDVWLAASDATLRFDGNAWSHVAADPTIQSGDTQTPVALAARASDDVWVFRGFGRIAHFDGTALTAVPTGANVQYVGCGAAPGDLLGLSGAALYSGKPGAMQLVASSPITYYEPFDAWIGAQDDVWMIGNDADNPGGNQVLRYDGAYSTSLDTSGYGLIALWAFPGGEAYVVGYDSILHHTPQ